MKKSLPILLLAVLLLAVAWWLLRAPASNPAPVPLAPAPTENVPAASATNEPRTGAQPTSEEAYEAKRLTETRERGRSSNQPIRFYGKVIDQHGEPIPDVKVTMGLRTFKEPLPGVMGDGHDSLVLTTNAEGRFEITDAKGSVLEMRALDKPGYEASTTSINRGSYRYWAHPSEGPYRPNADAPEIFRMWKKQGAETLVRKGISASLRCDGTPSTFDLANGRATSSGDLRVTLVRDPVYIKPGQRNYDWQLTIESLGGGLSESDDEQMYLAPLEGYKPKLVIHMPANAPDWTDEKSLRLYIKLKDGKQYARAEIKALIGAARETTPFYITSFINPSGSRNLEYDSAQNIIKDPPPRTRTATPTP